MTANILKVLEFTAEKTLAIAGAQGVAGEPIVIGDVTVIPISSVSCGFAGGGTDLPAKQNSDAVMAGAGAKVSKTPLSFLAISGGEVQLLRVPQESAGGSILDTLKPMVEKLAATKLERKPKKK